MSLWEEFGRDAALLGGGGAVVAVLNVVFKFWLNKNKQDGDQSEKEYIRLSTRIDKLEISERACLETNAQLQRQIGELHGEIAGLRSLISRMESHSHTAQIVCDDQGIVTEWSPAATFLFGWSREESIGRPIIMLVPPRLRDQQNAAFRIAVEEKRGPSEKAATAVRETYGITKDGQEIPVTITLSSWEFQGRRMFSASVKRR